VLLCIPKLLHVRKIRLWIWRQRDHDPMLNLLSAFCKNGSLYEIELASNDGDFWVTPSARHAAMLRAYGQRNELMPGLLQPRVDEDGDGSCLSLVPSIFAAARPVLRMAPTLVLQGLLSLADSAGLPRDAKRCCQ
jgi:hypothetical protein